MTPIPSPATGRQSTTTSAWRTLSTILGATIVVLSAILGACTAGSSPSVDGSSAPSASAVETASPSVSQEPTATPAAPSPEPTPIAEWTGVVWSDPVTPPFTLHLTDLLRWGDGYVAVGEIPGQGPYASLSSPDGLNWTIEQHDFPGAPRHLVALRDELLAFMPLVGRSSPPGTIVGAPPTSQIWRSTDGATWALVDSLSWEGAWHDAIPGLHSNPDGWNESQHDVTIGLADVASGPDGLVAIGNSFGTDAMEPIVLRSSDGLNWTSSGLPAGSDSVLLNSVVEQDGRFVITGATDVWTDPATARPAGWYSDDGLTWIRAAIEPDGYGLDAGADLGPLWAGADGLLACRGNREMGAGGWRYMMEWLSTDGSSWRPAPDQDQSHACDWSASDGTRIVSLGPRDHASPTSWPGVTAAYTSTDGSQWRSLELSSTLTDRLEAFWVVPDGVIYAGVQSFWFGAAQVAE